MYTVKIFAFGFTGPSIKRDVMTDKFQKVEVGVFPGNGDIKYCCLQLFCGRLRTNLINLIWDYNSLVDSASRISLARFAEFPVIFTEMDCVGSPVDRQLRQDRMTKPETYETWTNPPKPHRRAQTGPGIGSFFQPV